MYVAAAAQTDKLYMHSVTQIGHTSIENLRGTKTLRLCAFIDDDLEILNLYQPPLRCSLLVASRMAPSADVMRVR